MYRRCRFIAATLLIRSGRASVVLAGATEAPITPLVVAAFGKIAATSTKRNSTPEKASRPFDQARDGFVLAEGAALFVIESLDHAIKRDVPIYGEIIGGGSNNNCFHMTDIPQDGISIARSCQLAIEDARISVQDIDFINAHGSSTQQNDQAEALAFHQIFGSHIHHIPVTSIKSLTGHALSAANGIEIVSSLLTIRDGIIPPTINLENQDPNCNLWVIANRAINKKVRCVLKTSSGFSGLHSSLILKEFQG